MFRKLLDHVLKTQFAITKFAELTLLLNVQALHTCFLACSVFPVQPALGSASAPSTTAEQPAILTLGLSVLHRRLAMLQVCL